MIFYSYQGLRSIDKGLSMKKIIISTFGSILLVLSLVLLLPKRTEAAEPSCIVDDISGGQVVITLENLDTGDNEYFLGIWPKDCKSFNAGNTKFLCEEVGPKPSGSSTTTATIKADVFHAGSYYTLIYERKPDWNGCTQNCGTFKGDCYFTITEAQGAQPCGYVGECTATEIPGCTEEKVECCEVTDANNNCLEGYYPIISTIPIQIDPNTGEIITPWGCKCTCARTSTPYDPCKNLPDRVPDSEQFKCYECYIRDRTWTALGCIPSQPADFIKTLIRIGFGIGGGIAFLFMVMGVIKILTSQGNPETLNDGRGMITSAIAGLLLIIFSVIVLKIIGVDILELPGFKK